MTTSESGAGEAGPVVVVVVVVVWAVWAWMFVKPDIAATNTARSRGCLVVYFIFLGVLVARVKTELRLGLETMG
jgi:hypothetical protein